MRNPINLLIFLVLVVISNTYCQKSTLELTFTATYNEQHIPLDSVLIENLSQGGDTTLYFPDTVLVLDYITKIGNNNTGQTTPFVSQNYPNPFNGETKININLPKKQKVNIIVRDIVGRKINQFENILQQGLHVFAFYPGSDTYYLFTVTGNNFSKTIKMVNTKSNQLSRSQSKLIHTVSTNNCINYKSTNSISSLLYTFGDTLRYIAYSHSISEVNGSGIIKDAPLTNTIYEFEINEGIPCPEMPTVSYDNQVYNTIQIGNQCWLKENLNIGLMINGNEDMSDNGIVEKYCYDNDEDNCNEYGGLYQWDEIMQYNILNHQGICPQGWHIPTDYEWKVLEGAVDSQYGFGHPQWDAIGWRGFDAGFNLKSDSGWISGGNGSNIFGFNDLPAAYRDYDGTFLGVLGEISYFWASNHEGEYSAWFRIIDYYFDGVIRNYIGRDLGFSVRCLKGDTIYNVPTILTGVVSNITTNSADIGGDIIGLGSSVVTQHGHCWSINPNPTIEDFKTELGEIGSIGAYTSNIEELASGTNYYIKAYATNNEGTAYGDMLEFETLPILIYDPCPDLPTITYEDQVYNTVLIGEQCWLKENLNVGTMINGNDNMTDNGIIEKYCFDNDTVFCDIYGGLYQWDEVMQYETATLVQGICPNGWHLPSDDEWKILEGNTDSQFPVGDPEWENESWRGFDAGLNLKSTTGWNSGGNGTDLYGFNAKASGFRSSTTNDFYGLEEYAYFWTSTEFNGNVWARSLHAGENGVNRDLNNKAPGLSVRCLKNDSTLILPIINTGELINISAFGAQIEGEIISLGSSSIIQHGHCWSINTNPTIANYISELGATSEIGTFTSSLSDLFPETTYYVKAYAINDEGISYGEEVEIETLIGVIIGEPCPDLPTVSYEGKVYNTKLIGDQCWLSENLNVGTMINVNQQQTNNDTIEKYCYDNDTANCEIYGGLYKWDEMMTYTTSEGVQGICPPEWHLPSDEEWQQLEGEVDSQFGYPDPEWVNLGGRGYDAGTNLKSISGWNSGGTGLDLFGFTALPGGFSNYSDTFEKMGNSAYFWTSTKLESYDPAYYREMEYNHSNIYRFWDDYIGISVRCMWNGTISGIPNVNTGMILNVYASTVQIEGELTYIGNSMVTQYGHCWSTEPNPTIEDNKTEFGEAIEVGIFVSNITGLNNETTYYVKAYATNNEGTAYGAEMTFETLLGGGMGDPCPGTPEVSWQGQIYSTVQIGDQCWMKENLNWETSGNSWCYDDVPENCDTYGRLYDWSTIMNGEPGSNNVPSGVQGICPTGWHLPSDPEWCIVTQFIDATVDCEELNYSGTDVGTKMKNTSGWNGTNASGFTALPGGRKEQDGSFDDITNNGFFWSCTDYSSIDVFGRSLHLNHLDIYRTAYHPNNGLSVRCIKDDTTTNIPSVSSDSIINITIYGAQAEGVITHQGSSIVYQHGHCWSTDPNPTLYDYKTELGVALGVGYVFTSELLLLDPETTYYVKAYATNGEGTAYGDEIVFETLPVSILGNPCPGTPDVSWQGQTYNTIQIGDQCWMKENLNWEIEGNSWCYDNNPNNCDTYGRLYDWETMMNGGNSSNLVPSGVQGICPTGWHLPSDAEWCILTLFLDPTVDCNEWYWASGTDIGTKMKSTSGWNSGGNGTNISGFTSLPAGYKSSTANFTAIGNRSYYWSATEDESGEIYKWMRSLYHDEANVLRYSYYHTSGLSVRCVKD